MYPEELTKPMIKELTDFGFKEIKTIEDAEKSIKNDSDISLIVINSVCGCAAGSARPGVKLALEKSNKKPEKLYTVFAGVDFEATEKVRELCLPYPPSSPAIALFKNRELIHFVERHHIEGRDALMISEHLLDVFDEYCN